MYFFSLPLIMPVTYICADRNPTSERKQGCTTGVVHNFYLPGIIIFSFVNIKLLKDK